MHCADGLNPRDGGSSARTKGQELAHICTLGSPCSAGKVAETSPGQPLEGALVADLQAGMLRARKHVALAAVKEHLNPW